MADTLIGRVIAAIDDNDYLMQAPENAETGWDLRMARAILSALKDPPHEVLRAGAEAGRINRDEAAIVWQAMINAGMALPL